MSTYAITYKTRHNHPAGGTYVTGPYLRNVTASDSRTARDTITGLYPGAKIVRVRDLDAEYERRVIGRERART